MPFQINRLGIVVPHDGKSKEFIAGFREPYQDRDLKGFHYGFPLLLEPGQSHTIIGWARNDEAAVPIQLPLRLIKAS